ncbi:MAG: ornithine cyclodeaminase [Thermofilum sp.]|jgi:alanine dehydrogenase|nr:ornithine cyclodeaminase [Thermofilum sp.]
MSIRVLTAWDIAQLVRQVGIDKFMDGLIESLETTFKKWKQLKVTPRVSFHYRQGVVEAMPASDDKWYTVKIVNGHPLNPSRGLQTVVAVAVLVDIDTGYPLMFMDATLLTSLRTGAASALATKYLAREDSETLGVIGNGAQSEFLAYAVTRVANRLDRILAFDIDKKATEKFTRNMSHLGYTVESIDSPREVALNSDIIVTATASPGRNRVIEKPWVKPGTHINAVGGDAPGKTELDPELVRSSKLVVELLDQALVEGEAQNVGREHVYAELWEVVAGIKPGRTSPQEVTIFDSVGIAIEDLAAITYVYSLAQGDDVGTTIKILPETSNPKDLFSLVAKPLQGREKGLLRRT